MLKILELEFLKDYQALVIKRNNVIDAMNIELEKAYAEVDNTIINNKALSDGIKTQIKAELYNEYLQEYSTEEIDREIIFYEKYLSNEPEVIEDEQVETVEEPEQEQSKVENPQIFY